MDAPKEFELKRYTSNGSKACVVEVDLENPKDLRELHNDYSLASDTIEKKMLSNYQSKITDFYNIYIAFFFYLVFLSQVFLIHKRAGKQGSYLFSSSVPLPPASQTLRH